LKAYVSLESKDWHAELLGVTISLYPCACLFYSDHFLMEMAT
jgi:hypothetical protein